jgi:hypothetical protein
MELPTHDEYFRLIQSGVEEVHNEWLRRSRIMTDNGRPLQASGQVATVFEVSCLWGEPPQEHRLALRVFTSLPTPYDGWETWCQQRERAAEQLAADPSIPEAIRYFYKFDREAILTTTGHLVPAILREWFPGVSLPRWLGERCVANDRAALSKALEQWNRLLRSLHQHRIVHGQLKPRHAVVQSPEDQESFEDACRLRLVDYDFLQVLTDQADATGPPPRDLGHLQHPDFRRPHHLTPESVRRLDVFPALFVLTVLKGLTLDPTLGRELGANGHEQAFVITEEDLDWGTASELYHRLAASGDRQWFCLYGELVNYYKCRGEQLPEFAEVVRLMDDVGLGLDRPTADVPGARSNVSVGHVPPRPLDSGSGRRSGDAMTESPSPQTTESTSGHVPLAEGGETAREGDVHSVQSGGDRLMAAIRRQDDAEAERLFDVRQIREHTYAPAEQELITDWVERQLREAPAFARLSPAYPNVGLLKVEPYRYELDWGWPDPRFADECLLALCPGSSEPPPGAKPEDVDRRKERVVLFIARDQILLKTEPEDAECYAVVWPAIRLGFVTLYGSILVIEPKVSAERPSRSRKSWLRWVRFGRNAKKD